MSKKDLNAFDASEANEDELNAVTGGAGKQVAQAHVAYTEKQTAVQKQPGRNIDVGGSNTKPAFKDGPFLVKQHAAEKQSAGIVKKDYGAKQAY